MTLASHNPSPRGPWSPAVFADVQRPARARKIPSRDLAASLCVALCEGARQKRLRINVLVDSAWVMWSQVGVKKKQQ